jgi:predicted kinase
LIAEYAVGRILGEMETRGCSDATKLFHLLEAEEGNKENANGEVDDSKEKEQRRKEVMCGNETEIERTKNSISGGDSGWVKCERGRKTLRKNSGSLPLTEQYEKKKDHSPPTTDHLLVRQCPRGMTQEEAKNLLAIPRDQACMRLLRLVNSEAIPKLLIIMRGPSGSGKSNLASALLIVSKYGTICSADHYFMRNGVYSFDYQKLPAAHEQCQRYCEVALSKEKSPVIIDNTNLSRWEVDPYLKLGLKYNYAIRLALPETPWQFDPSELHRKCIHNVPKQKLREMVEKYEQLSVSQIIKDLTKSHYKDYNPVDSEQSPPQTELNPTPVKEYEDAPFGSPWRNPVLLSQYVTESPLTPRKTGTTLDSSILNNNYEKDTCDNGGKCVERTQRDSCKSFNPRMGAVFPMESEPTKWFEQSDASFRVRGNRDNDETMTVLHTGKRGCSDKSRSTRSAVHNNANMLPEQADEFPTLDGSLSTDARFLLNAFPDCGKEELLDFFNICHEDLNDTIGLLLDSGYKMNCDWNRGRRDSIHIDDASQNQEVPVQISASIHTSRSQSPPTSMRAKHSSGTSLSSGSKVGARSNRNSRDLDSPFVQRKAYTAPELDPETLVNDGPDWVSMELPKDFVKTLSAGYGPISGLSSSVLTREDRTVRIPPSMAFELFAFLDMNVAKRQREAIERGIIAASNLCDEDGANGYGPGDDVSFSEYKSFEEAAHQYQQLEADKVLLDDATGLSIQEITALEEANSVVDRKKKEFYRSNVKKSWAAQIKFQELLKKFPSMDRDVIDDIFLQCSFDEKKTEQEIMAIAPSKFVPVAESSVKVTTESPLPTDSNKEVEYDPDKVAFMSVSKP